MKKLIIFAAAVLAAAINFAPFPISIARAKTVVVQADAPALAAGSSYAWAPTNSALVDPASTAVANEITAKRLQTAIETTLAGHGYRKATGVSAANLAVSFHVVVQQQKDARVVDNGVRVCGWRGCVRTWAGNPTVTTYNYNHGTLVIDLVDRKTGALVWRAVSEDRVSANDVTQEELNETVAKMMKALPIV